MQNMAAKSRPPSLPNHLKINWTDIQLDASAKTYNECIIGKGSFGTVFRAKYIPSTGSKVLAM